MKYTDFNNYIIHEDEEFIILNKPPFITSEKDNAGISFSDILKNHIPTAMLCHRLDKETSGVMVAAKNEEIYRYFSIQLEGREVSKVYHLLISGAHNMEERVIDIPLSKKTNKAVADYEHGKYSDTIVQSLEVFRHYTLMAAMPVTGRFHQIRIHMASINRPICGDTLYGGSPVLLSSIKKKYKESAEGESPIIKRTALHAYTISFQYRDEVRSYTAPYPKDFETALKQLRKFDC